MAPVILKEVIVYSSQDRVHRAANLLVHESSQWKRWLCAPEDHSGAMEAEFQLAKAAKIVYIDIGNYGSAFVGAYVSKSSWPANKYVTLFPATMFMSPMECKSGQNKCGVKMFTKNDLNEESFSDEFDRVKIVCTQPYKKNAQFGLAFIRLRSMDDVKQSVTVDPGPTMTKLHSSPREVTPMASTPKRHQFLSPSWKRNSTFQRQNLMATSSDSCGESAELASRLLKMAATADCSGSDKYSSLSRSAKMVLSSAASKKTPPKQGHHGKYNPQSPISAPTSSSNQPKYPVGEACTRQEQGRDSIAENHCLPTDSCRNALSNSTIGNRNSPHGPSQSITLSVNSKKGKSDNDLKPGLARNPTKRKSASTLETSPGKIRTLPPQQNFQQTAPEYLASLGRRLLDSKLSDIRPDLERLLGYKLSKTEKAIFKELALKRVDTLLSQTHPEQTGILSSRPTAKEWTPKPTARQQVPTARQQTPKEQAPTARQQAPTARQQAPTARQQAPTARQQAPTARQQAPTARQQTARQQAPTARQQAPTARQQAPTARQQAPTARQQTPKPTATTIEPLTDGNTANTASPVAQHPTQACPICFEEIPVNIIEAHADLCLERSILINDLDGGQVELYGNFGII